VDRGVAIGATHDGDGNEELVDREMWKPKELQAEEGLRRAAELLAG
jgi:hypothetical protein